MKLLVAPFLAPEPTSTTLEFAEGVVLSKTFSTSREIDSVELLCTMGGQEVPPQFLSDLSLHFEEAL